jgi:hypothetical protein
VTKGVEEWAAENEPGKFESERRARALTARTTELEAQVKDLLRRLDRADHRTNVVLGIKNRVEPKPIKSRRKRGGEAVAVAMASDWHVGETVDPATINGKNSYDMEIAEVRARRFFQSVAKLIEKERRDIRIDAAILAVLGDIVTGAIHADIAESSSTYQTEEVLFAKRLLIDGIDFLLEVCELKRLYVDCTYGNHGRTTIRPRIATAAGYNLEWLMYNIIAEHYAAKGEKRIEFGIATGSHLYRQVFDYMIRWHHGDQIRYYGGVSGLQLPLNKSIREWNVTKHADLTCVGHFHTLTWGRDFVCNGSNVGYGAYAQSIKARFEKPQQAFFLIDKRKGRTVMCPIDVEDGGEA